MVGSLTWPEAMGLVVIDGLIIVLLAVTGLRRLVFDAVPMQLKLAISAGIGLFILFIGLVDAGFIGSTGQPSPPVGLGIGGIGSINTVPTVVFVFTLLVTGILVVAAGARRHPHRARGGHSRRGRHRGDLAPGAGGRAVPAAGACRYRRCRDRRSRFPTSPSSVTSAWAASVVSACSPR